MTQSPWDDDDNRPVVAPHHPPSFVAPAPPTQRRPEPPPSLWQPTSPTVADAWRPQHTISESATPEQRARALIIRQASLWLIWLVLAVAAALAAWQLAGLGSGLSALFGLAVFGGCAAAAFVALDRAERADSAVGLEKHRINRAAELEKLRLLQEYELRQAALDAFIKRMEGGDHEPD